MTHDASFVAERSPYATHWILDPAVRFADHGSFGACPRPVLAAQAAVREQLERQPVRFVREPPTCSRPRARPSPASSAPGRRTWPW